MLKSEGCRLFLLLSLLTGLYSVNGNVSKRSCLGESIKIIENITYNSNDIVVSIYKNGDIGFILGMWHIQDGVPVIKNGQSDRLVLDKKGNIWILNLIISDEAKYTIKIDIGNSSKIYHVPLDVLAPPTKNCKPNIIRAGNNLFAELKTDECGRPPASAYWLEHPGISISKQILELQPGNDNGIYHACIEGDSLICAKISNFSEHCSSYNKSDPKSLINQSVVDSSNPRNSHTTYNIPFASSESSTITIVICVMVVLCFILLSVKQMKTLYQCWKEVPETQKEETDSSFSSPTNPPAAPKPSTCPGVNVVSGLSNLQGHGIGTHSNGPEDTELKSITEEGENHPLLQPIDADRSSPRSTFDTSSFEEEGSHNVGKMQVQGDTSYMIPQRQPRSSNPKKATDASSLEERSETISKHLVQGDSDHSIAQGVPGSFNPKMSIGFPDSRAQADGGFESAGKHPANGAEPKSTGTRQKSITALPPGKP